jgi:mono/diheme cytochrome c family protein
LTALAVLGGSASLARAADAADPGSVDFFENRIRPVLAERCDECHGARAESLKGGLRLDSKAGWQKGGASGTPAIVPGQPGQSLLIQVVKGLSAEVKAMPPKGGPLTPGQIADLEAWIRAGATDPRGSAPAASTASPADVAARHWAFQPIRPPATPPVRKASWVRTGMDAFILAALEAKGLSPTPEADRRTLLRRVTHDDRAAAHARGDGRLPQGPVARCLRPGGGPAARLGRLW